MMKKKITIVLVVVLVITMISGIASAAEKLDLKKLSDDELLTYYKEMRKEIIERGLVLTEPVKLLKGDYTVGYDFPAGDYDLICERTIDDETKNAIEAVDDVYSALGLGKLGDFVEATGEAVDKVGDVTVAILSKEGKELKSYELTRGKNVKITLEEGQTVKVSDGCVSLDPVL